MFSYPNYLDLKARSEAFSQLAIHRRIEARLGSMSDGIEIPGEMVSGNYFLAMGVGAALGRTLLPADDGELGASPVVVLSDAVWRGRFGSDPEVVGRQIRLAGTSFSVVGVLPPSFQGTHQVLASSFWVPVSMHQQVRPTGDKLEMRGWGWLHGTARLRPGVSLEQARAEVSGIAGQLVGEHPRINRDLGFTLYPASRLPESYRQGVTGMMGFLLLVVSVVLLVACANIASVLMTRAVARRQEMAIRRALGATRARLVRQWLIESVLLAGVGGTLGVLLAMMGQRTLVGLIPADVGFVGFAPYFTLDGQLLLFGLVVTGLSGVLFGLFPALHASRRQLRGGLGRPGEWPVAGGVPAALAPLWWLRSLFPLCCSLWPRFCCAPSTKPGFSIRGSPLRDYCWQRSVQGPLVSSRSRQPRFIGRSKSDWRIFPGWSR